MSEPHMRAADSDRAAVAAALGRHMADGRLTVEEYEDRVTRAYAARTYGELAALTADLPSSGLAGPPARRGATSVRRRGHRRSAWISWARVAVIVTVIWLFAAIASGGFWPIWVIGPWGVILLSRTFGRPYRHHPCRRLPG